MKRTLSLFIVATFLLFSVVGDCLDWRWYRASEPIVYRGTVTGLRISAVDGGATESGGAFVDGLPQAILDLIAANPAGTLQFDAYDSAGRMLRGVLKAAGSGEGLGNELIVNSWVNNVTTPYDTLTASGKDLTSIISNGVGNSYATSDLGAALERKLVKLVVNSTFTSGAIVDMRTITTPPVTYEGTITTSAVRTYYRTEVAGQRSLQLFNGDGSAGNLSATFTFKQVLAPSTSGAVITSLKNGTLFNWAVNQWVAESYNQVSYTVIVRQLR